MRAVTLFVPWLFWPETGDTDPYSGLRLPALETLLTRGGAASGACENESAWICERFGVKKQIDWPVAPIAFAGDGGEPSAAYWMRADPVNLRVQNDGLVLFAPGTVELSEDESRDLTGALTRQFEAEGFVFHAAHPQRWYLKLPRTEKIRTVTLTQAIGRDVNHLLPSGEERLRWHRIINDAQMLLHAHPVNAAREDRGAAVVNSLWFWGGGTLPASSSPFDAIQSEDPLTMGLAKLADIHSSALPVGDAWAAGNNALVVLGDAQREFMRGNVSGWRNVLESLEARWFARIFEWLRSGRIDKAAIATVVDGRSHEWSITRGARWQIWRRTQPLFRHARNVLLGHDAAPMK